VIPTAARILTPQDVVRYGRILDVKMLLVDFEGPARVCRQVGVIENRTE
jgi:hypothetical protein